jgi:hypothetical protein
MNAEHLGSPGISVGGLQIWVHGRESSNSAASWDDWVIATARCGGAGADVWVHGSIMRLSEMRVWVEGCERIHRNLSGRAVLDGIEPELFVSMEVSDSLGHLKVSVSITPDHLRQQHKFDFELDQSFLPSMIQECQSVLSNFGLKVEGP